jgi:putative ABC transport system ATP-binding protein
MVPAREREVTTNGALVTAQALVREHGRGAARRAVVDEVDLVIHPGELVAIVGASGSGKSTLLHLLAGLDRPTSGSITLGGTPLDGMSEAQLARLRQRFVGFVFQSFRLVPELTAWENVLMPVRLARDLGAGRERARAIMDRLGVASVGAQLPGDLSGGEQQRVAIARALVMEPRVIFADEPTGNLDEHSGAEVIALLRDAVTPTRAVVMVTHDADQAAGADRTVHIRDGRIDG